VGQVLSGQSLNTVLPPISEQVAARDRALLQQLCFGCLRFIPRLEALLAELLSKPLRDRDDDLRGLLLVGLYQLDETRIPDHAAVAATVAATRALGKGWAKGLVNAVLRRYLRERQPLNDKLTPAAAAAHPQWLHQAVLAEWPQHAADIIEANNRQPPMTLRVNTRMTTRDEMMQAIAASGLESAPGVLSPDAIYLGEPCDVHRLPGFDEGHLSVQDEAAQLAAPLLAAAPGERILDACAAPGGKTCHVLENQPRLAEITALDIAAPRLQRVNENLHRLGLQATVLEADAAAPPDSLGNNSFDRILVDAPCSATGVIRRHPDIKVLRRAEDIDTLSRQQRAILDGVWPLLKSGGTLLYVTCSIMEAENSAVVAAFVAAHPDARLSIPDADWGVAVSHGRQLLPSIDGPDGLFFCLLEKVTQP
jgi:16S rRNA (cytosine967-C5)-methyltransferase